MPDTHSLLLFVVAGWILNLTPGPDVLYVVRNALRYGARAGVVAGLGITGGCFVHVAAAAVGMGALLASSAWAFNVVKWVGAAYLVWVGVKLLLTSAGASPLALAAEERGVASAAPDMGQIFTGGFWTNVLNPKVVLFFLAFVPQFIAPEADNKTWAFVALGVIFNLNAIPINTAWALAAAWLAGRVALVQRAMHWLDRVAGLMFVGFGAKLALTHTPTP
ncbi:LysE family translocator [Rhodoferax aquaticus]|uniref:LysE family translocator n=1 Tax=Rhodoferax aquaticus TaxID=2527691 RepID=A0A515EU94_9BURK|nr:LysE family translocator [Rhodoferax aquaticus]QDL56252.1 LysE family translocator [Rhodoferax aquaticus]